ncbi:MAG: thioredoxin family protein [Cyclobacteriaceae bacterium]
MKTIKILGTGCPKCKQTISVVQQALEQKKLQADVQKVEDIEKIMQYNVLSTPAVVVDEEVKIKGRVPSVNEILSLLEN